MIFLLSLSALSAAAQLPPPGSSRVYIQINGHQKDLVVNNINRGGGTVHYEFDRLNAVAATLPDQAIAALQKSSSVLKIEPDPARYLLSNEITNGLLAVEADDAWVGTGATGTGITVGVIDSGIYPNHKDLNSAAIDGAPNQVRARINSKGKPIYDMVDLTEDDEAYWGRDLDGHGTHVSGTIAGVLDGFGVAGVAPDVNIFMVKVFGDDGGWIYSSSLVNAVQTAVDAGADVINMSLGGPTASSTEQAGMDSFLADGVVLVAAAGNDGNTAYSYPASYDSVISVAAVAVTETPTDPANKANYPVADFSQKNNQVEISAPGVSVLSTVPYLDASVAVSGTEIYAFGVENAALTDANGISGELVDGDLALSPLPEGDLSWQGKVVLVERGTNSFNDKVANVEASGGVAAIIYNNISGDISATLGTGNSSLIPAVTVSDINGDFLLGEVGKEAAAINYFRYKVDGYAAWDGTSMATPHVAGGVALMLDAHSDASPTPAQIRQAIAETALDLGASGRDDATGHGLLQINQAITRLGEIIQNGGGGGGGVDPPATSIGINNVDAQWVNEKRGTFRITWTTTEPADGKVIFSTGEEFFSAEYTTAHTFNFRGRKGATYTFSVRSSNASGVEDDGPYTFP